jgi:uncharacterized protein (DUF885 family)
VRTLLLVAFLNIPGLARAAAPPSATHRLAALEQRYLDGLFRAKPHLADYMGDHRFAGKLSDLTPAGLRARITELQTQQRALDAIDRQALDADGQIDAAILQDGIALELLELTEIREWTWDPRLRDGFTYYDPREVVAARLSDIVHGSWGTPEERRLAVTAQLLGLPRWLRARERSMEKVSKVHLQQAVKDNRGRITFFETEVAGAPLVNRVKDAIAADHPKKDELVQASAAKLVLLRAFLDENQVVTLPPAETLSVEPMPEYKRGGSGAEYLSPGGLDRKAPFHGTYYVEPVDPTWPAEKVESYLRANNDYEIALTAAHEALPGHHTQAWWARRDPSALRATLWSGPFAEGWAVYGEGLVVKCGFGAEKNDRYRFMDLRGHMIVASNALLDAALQGGAMTDEEALRFMVEEGFQEKAQAERKLLRAKLDSTQLSQYFLGFTEIGRLEEEARAAGPFDQRAFDEKLLAHGTIAVKHLRRFVLGK